MRSTEEKFPLNWTVFVWSVFWDLLEPEKEFFAGKTLVLGVPGLLSPLALVYNKSSTTSPKAAQKLQKVLLQQKMMPDSPKRVSEYLRRWQLSLYKSCRQSQKGNFFNRGYRLLVEASQSSSFGMKSLEFMNNHNLELVIANNSDAFKIQEAEQEQQNWIIRRCRLTEDRHTHLLKSSKGQAKVSSEVKAPIPNRIFEMTALPQNSKDGLLESLNRFSITLDPSSVKSVKCCINFVSRNKEKLSTIKVKGIRLVPNNEIGEFNVTTFFALPFVTNDKQKLKLQEPEPWKVIDIPVVGDRLKLFVVAQKYSDGDLPGLNLSGKFEQVIKAIRFLCRDDVHIKSSLVQMYAKPIKSVILPLVNLCPRKAVDLKSTLSRQGNLESMFNEAIFGELAEKIVTVQHLSILDISLSTKKRMELEQFREGEEETTSSNPETFEVNSPFLLILWDLEYNAPLVFAKIGTPKRSFWNFWKSEGPEFSDFSLSTSEDENFSSISLMPTPKSQKHCQASTVKHSSAGPQKKKCSCSVL